jgi:hypothetical protein
MRLSYNHTLVHLRELCGWVDATYHLGNLLENTVKVGVDPVRTVDCESSSRSETGKVIRGLVDRSNGEGIHVSAILDEVEDTINSLVRVVEVGGVIEPVIMEESLADVEVVDATRKRVKTDDDCSDSLVWVSG